MYKNPFYSQNYSNCFERCSQKTSVPEPQHWTQCMNKGQNLEVPHNNEIPMGMENDTFSILASMDSERYFTCPDGSVIDLLTHKKICSSKVERDTRNKSQIKWIDRFSKTDNQWQRVEDMIRNIDMSHPVESAIGMNRDDIEYQRMTNKKSEELKRNMTQEQKNVLANLDKFIGKTKLDEVNSIPH